MSKVRTKAHHRASLSVAAVKEIVKSATRAKKPATAAELAEKHGVTVKTIYNILNGRTWADVTGIEPKPVKSRAAAEAEA